MKDWELSFGFVPGLILGYRSYIEEYKTDHVLYLLFMDVCFTVHK